VAIFALLASFVAPNLGAVRSRALRSAAERVAAQLEFGRERAIVTGVPHRLLVDLDAAAYRLEWLVTEARALGEPEPPPFRAAALAHGAPLDLEPPVKAGREYRPLTGPLGRFQRLDPDLAFSGVESDDGWVERGEAAVAFASDGSADFATLVIDDGAGKSVALEVLPLASAVRIHDEPR
jgi:hypothetical protein